MMNKGARFGASKATWIATGLLVIGFLFVISFAGCSLLPVSEEQALEETRLKETQLEVNTQQTLMAQQEADKRANSTLSAQQATLDAQQTKLVQGGAAATEQSAASEIDAAQATQAAAGQATQAAEHTAAAQPSEAPPPIATVDMQSRMASAKILVFEDMTSKLNTNRYAKDTLDKMGLPYVDVGSAQGLLKTEVSSGGPDGKGWDLVIIAAESKDGGTAGEYFDYVLSLLDEGASVIFEVWYLDDMHGGAASTLMTRCGIAYEGDMLKVPPARMVMFPLNYDHPIMQYPNSGIKLTDTMSYWWGDNKSYDTGDLVKITLRGDAALLVGSMADEKQTHGTVTVCFDNRLILQTFSSHNLTFNAMRPLWENYIYNALRVRFENTP
ncbi:MAG: hypothetical protein JXA78_12325 [Anaerolineales bacterium]|nr:hypothetical protein [Anaerolineales bacterium]